MVERLKSEQIKEICRVQHKMVVAKYLITKMPIAYTNMDIGRFEKDMKIRSIAESCEEEMKKLIDKYSDEIIKNTFSDIEYLQKQENRFTFDEQKQATKEVIGKELTLEEVFEQY